MNRLPASPPDHFDAHCSRASGSFKLVLGICVFLALVTWVVFGQTLKHGFVNFDDPKYVYQNPEVTRGLSLHGIGWAFTHIHSRNWHPLTSISHMLDCQLYGLKAGGHHCTNVVLHTFGVVLLFLVLRETTGTLWCSAFVAALFAIHPLHVESVAWVSERKDVLSGVFFMLTLAAYVRYVRKPSLASYLLVALLFALGLISKPMLVTVPFVLLLLDYWPLKRFTMQTVATNNSALFHWLNRLPTTSRLMLEKVPLLLLSVGSCLVTLVAQGHAVGSLERLPLIPRAINAIMSCLSYIYQMLWPARLALFYPYPSGRLSIWPFVLAIGLLIAITAWALKLRNRRPYFITGWLWYLVMLVPVIGIVQVGSQAHADRYTYLPHIGLYLGVTWAVSELSASWRHRRVILAAVAGVTLIALTSRALAQTSYWKDSESLWSHAIAVTRNNAVAHRKLGNALFDKRQLDRAIFHFQECLKIYSELGQGGSGAAFARNGLGNALLEKGLIADAISQYRKALEVISDYSDAEYNLGLALFREGRIDEAITHWQKTLSFDPGHADAHASLGHALLRKKLTGDAIAHYERSLQIAPQSTPILNTLAWVLATSSDAQLRNGARAVELARQADELAQGKDPIFIRTLAAAYAESGRFNDAIAAAQRALKLAQAKGDSTLANKLQMDIDLYRMNFPLR